MFSIRSQLPISASVSIPAEQSQSISTIPGGRKIETVPEKEGLLVFLGTKSVGEYALNILGQNVSRVTTGKNLMIYYSCTKLQNKILIKRKQSLPFLVQKEVIYNQVTPMLLPQQL